MIYVAHYASPVGKLTLAAKDDALVGLWIKGQKAYLESLKEEVVEKENYPVLRLTKKWLDKYFAGKKPKISELKLAPMGSAFAKPAHA